MVSIRYKIGMNIMKQTQKSRMSMRLFTPTIPIHVTNTTHIVSNPWSGKPIANMHLNKMSIETVWKNYSLTK